jgi:uncharacterized membrane protein YdjX (TVP38/TMEM64 family)
LSENVRSILVRVGGIVLVIALSIYLVSIRDKIEHLLVYGYPGIFLVALLSSATVLIPAPGLAVIFGMGAVFPPALVALCGGLGAGTGELTGYLAGFSGRAAIEKTKVYERITPIVQKYGALGIFVLAAIPNPVFDMVGITAGALRIPLWQFLLAAIGGNIVKMMIFAYAGSLSLNWLLKE